MIRNFENAREAYKNGDKRPKGISKKYLMSRGIYLQKYCRDIRFLDDCIIAKCRSTTTGKVSGCLVIEITANESGFKTKKRNFGKVKNTFTVIQGKWNFGKAILVEGFEDGLSLLKMGVTSTVCSTNGTSGMTTFRPSKYCKSVTIVPDNDEAGRNAAAKFIQVTRGENIIANIHELPLGKDANEYLNLEREKGGKPKLKIPVSQENQDLPHWCMPIPKVDNGFVGHSVAELHLMKQKPLKYLVKDTIPVGLIIVAGRPKIGKSLFVTDLAIGTGYKRKILGKSTQMQGSVLYLALEDSSRRITERLEKLGPDIDWCEDKKLTIWCMSSGEKFPELDKGGIEKLKSWISITSDPVLIIIDVLEKVRPSPKGRQSEYKAAYNDFSEVNKLANEHGICVVAVTHTRKSNGKSEDPFQTILGTTGLEAVADAALVFVQAGSGIELHGRGRDLPAFSRSVALKNCRWRSYGKPEVAGLSRTQKTVLKAIRKSLPESVSPNQIIKKTGVDESSVQKALGVLCRKGLVRKPTRGQYRFRR